MKFGINPVPADYFYPERNFMNLFMYDGWRKIQGSNWDYFKPEELTPTGWLKTMPANTRSGHYLFVPETGPQGVTIKCTWDGNMPAHIQFVQDAQEGKNQLSFKATNLPGTGWKAAFFYFDSSEFNPADPIRNIDCREADAPKDQRFAPEFLNRMSQYKVVRYMDMQRTNYAAAVSWANRTTQTSPDTERNDGISVEDIVAISNQSGTDPWVTQPWLADADYIRHFAQYVHDNLAPGRKVYVETANEAWNYAFKISGIVQSEGLAEGLAPDGFTALLNRYAERSTEVMKIWTQVFADNPSRLVRIVATQNVGPFTASTVLGFRDTARYVDALATAPYFGYEISGTTDVNKIFTQLQTAVDNAISAAAENKKIATKYGIRYIAYEAGQHVINMDVATQQKLQRDNRMYDTYMRYINAWKTQIGDLITFFNSSGTISDSAFGIQEYASQPIAQAPKYRAIMNSRPQ